MNPFALMAEFKELVTAAQQRMNDRSISTSVKAGKIQISRVTFDKAGRSKIEPVTEYLSIDEARDYLKGMGA